MLVIILVHSFLWSWREGLSLSVFIFFFRRLVFHRSFFSDNHRTWRSIRWIEWNSNLKHNSVFFLTASFFKSSFFSDNHRAWQHMRWVEIAILHARVCFNLSEQVSLLALFSLWSYAIMPANARWWSSHLTEQISLLTLFLRCFHSFICFVDPPCFSSVFFPDIWLGSPSNGLKWRSHMQKCALIYRGRPFCWLYSVSMLIYPWEPAHASLWSSRKRK